MIRVFFIALILPFSSYAQSIAFQEADRELNKSLALFFNRYPQEKALLITDNTTYLQGESLWYKIFLWDQSDEDLSNSAYVVVRNTSGKTVFKQHILLIKGEGHGDFLLPDTLTGVFSLEVFTPWMMNFYNEPIASRLIWVSDGNQTFTDYTSKLRDPVIMPEGGSLVCDGENKIAVFSGMLGSEGFTFELFDPAGGSIYFKRFDTPFGIAKVKPQITGSYRAQICIPALDKCFDSLIITDRPSIRLLQRMGKQIQIKVTAPDQRNTHQKIFVCNEQKLIDFRQLPEKNSNDVLHFNPEEYPEGPVYFVLVDEDGTIRSTRAIYNSRNPTPQFSMQIEKQELAQTWTQVNIKLQALNKIQERERVCVWVQTENVVTGSPFLREVEMDGEESFLNDLMLFKEFTLKGLITNFLKTSSLPVKYSATEIKNDFETNLNSTIYNATPIDIALSGFTDFKKIDSVVSFKKDLKRIKKTYGFDHKLIYEKIPSDETYYPGDYPGIHNTIEFLTLAIPKLKIKKANDTYSMNFMYTNLKGQKALYSGTPSIVINGFKGNINFLKELPITDISSIEVLYNSKTITQSNLNSLLPFGAIFIYLTDNSIIGNRIERERPLFSEQFDWPHRFPENSVLFSDKPNVRLPIFKPLLFWNADLALNKQGATFSYLLPSLNISSTVRIFSLKDSKRNIYTEIKIE